MKSPHKSTRGEGGLLVLSTWTKFTKFFRCIFFNIKNSFYFFEGKLFLIITMIQRRFYPHFYKLCKQQSDALKKVHKGGVFQKSTQLLGGLIQKSTSVHKGGGGSKMAQNWSTWFKDDPYTYRKLTKTKSDYRKHFSKRRPSCLQYTMSHGSHTGPTGAKININCYTSV